MQVIYLSLRKWEKDHVKVLLPGGRRHRRRRWPRCCAVPPQLWPLQILRRLSTRNTHADAHAHTHARPRWLTRAPFEPSSSLRCNSNSRLTRCVETGWAPGVLPFDPHLLRPTDGRQRHPRHASPLVRRHRAAWCAVEEEERQATTMLAAGAGAVPTVNATACPLHTATGLCPPSSCRVRGLLSTCD